MGRGLQGGEHVAGLAAEAAQGLGRRFPDRGVLFLFWSVKANSGIASLAMRSDSLRVLAAPTAASSSPDRNLSINSRTCEMVRTRSVSAVSTRSTWYKALWAALRAASSWSWSCLGERGSGLLGRGADLSEGHNGPTTGQRVGMLQERNEGGDRGGGLWAHVAQGLDGVPSHAVVLVGQLVDQGFLRPPAPRANSHSTLAAAARTSALGEAMLDAGRRPSPVRRPRRHGPRVREAERSNAAMTASGPMPTIFRAASKRPSSLVADSSSWSGC